MANTESILAKNLRRKSAKRKLATAIFYNALTYPPQLLPLRFEGLQSKM